MLTEIMMQAAEEYEKQQSPKTIAEQLAEAERKSVEGEGAETPPEVTHRSERGEGEGEGEGDQTEVPSIMDFDHKTDFDQAMEVS